MNQQQLRIYRQLLREINRQFTSVNGNHSWAAQLRLQWLAASPNHSSDSSSNINAARNILCYLSNKRKYKGLLDEFNPKLSETDRVEKTARRVGLETPKALGE
ncbi:hypothetical protein GGI26_000358 [Coemansia sp. RSA 1358]|nr:hypothetical protein BX070DRAFT_232317 [Coemansia spiralis]KAJ2625559.1 hypothetical protein GGI26_000358 [Coemansia sp. RSA 1358]